MFRFVIPLFTLYYVCASIILGTAVSYIAVFITALLVMLSTLDVKPLRVPYMEFVQILIIGAFHCMTQVNWCMILYMLVFGYQFYQLQNSKKAVILFLFTVFTFTTVRIVISPLTLNDMLEIFVSLLSFLVFLYLCEFLVTREKQNRELNMEKKRLSTHDALTGLLNYEEFHKKLHDLLKDTQDQLILVLIDCTDLKTMNTEQGFHEGNRMLKQVADLLQIVFTDALLMARYGGDEFALVLKLNDGWNTVEKISYILSTELPTVTGIQLTYGCCTYPDQGMSKDELILMAETNLYSMKREIWLKREDQMLRSEKLRVVGELASGMAHEIRNPLTTIKGFLQLSRQNHFTIEPWYGLIMDEINRMSELTAEFLQFSKPHVTHYKIQPLQNCIQRVIYLMESEATRLGHEIHFHCDEAALNVLMDQDKIVQLLLNLVKNAFEAMEEEGIVAIRMQKQYNHVVLEIRDTGKGIPSTELDKIFNPFYTTKDIGTGLGLSICHKIVHDHSGLIEVESEIHRGTTFRIIFPLAR